MMYDQMSLYFLSTKLIEIAAHCTEMLLLSWLHLNLY